MRFCLALFVLLAVISGCGPEVAKSDLGVVEFKLPELAGADEPYAMPRLGPPIEHDDSPHRGPLR